MKLLTKAIRKTIPPLYTNEKLDASKVKIRVKFFDPCSQWTWYVTEGEPVLDDDGKEVDYRFFGYVIGHFNELGYFSLNELQNVKNRVGLGIERDMYFDNPMLSEVME